PGRAEGRAREEAPRFVSVTAASPGINERERPMLLMLEDNAERVQRFTATLQVIDPALRLLVWRSAKQMIREVLPYLSDARVISLDHDLEPLEGEREDPGDGLEVVKFLVSQPVVRPILIHSSNVQRSSWMAGELELAGWPYRSVAPIGDDWI